MNSRIVQRILCSVDAKEACALLESLGTQTLDLQKIAMIAILGVGAFFGLMMMGVI